MAEEDYYYIDELANRTRPAPLVEPEPAVSFVEPPSLSMDYSAYPRQEGFGTAVIPAGGLQDTVKGAQEPTLWQRASETVKNLARSWGEETLKDPLRAMGGVGTVGAITGAGRQLARGPKAGTGPHPLGIKGYAAEIGRGSVGKKFPKKTPGLDAKLLQKRMQQLEEKALSPFGASRRNYPLSTYARQMGLVHRPVGRYTGSNPARLQKQIEADRKFISEQTDAAIERFRADPRANPDFINEAAVAKDQIVESMLLPDIMKYEKALKKTPFYKSDVMKDWVYPGAGVTGVVGSPYVVDAWRDDNSSR